MSATHRVVNGVHVELSQAEAAAIQADWDANPPPTAEQLRDLFRAQAKAALDRQEDHQTALLRAALLVVLNELNAHTTAINDLLAAVDGAGNLAQLKAAVADIQSLKPRTPSQLRAAIKERIGSGEADS